MLGYRVGFYTVILRFEPEKTLNKMEKTLGQYNSSKPLTNLGTATSSFLCTSSVALTLGGSFRVF